MKLYALSQLKNCDCLSKEAVIQIEDFFKKNDLLTIAPGRYEIGGKNFVNVLEYQTKEDNGIYETHDLYIDVQAVITGQEIVKTANQKDCTLSKEYNPEKDVTLYSANENESAILNDSIVGVYDVKEPHKAAIMLETPEKVKKAVFKIYKNNDMKNVFLIGDSIRFGTSSPESLGYGPIVKDKLKGIANVYYPNDNCRFLHYTLRYLPDWARCGEFDPQNIDLVHWNNGLWDALHIDGDDPLTPLDVYASTLKRVYNKIRMYFPNAKIVFALSTPVIEDEQGKAFVRYNSEIETYNDTAKKILLELGVQINDLYDLTKNLTKAYRFDCVHFNNKGCELMADSVVEKVKELLLI